MTNVAVPNVLSDRQRAESVLNALQAIQTDQLNLKIARLRDGNNGGKPSGHYDAESSPVSYDERAKQLEQAARSLVEEHSDVLDAVKKLHAEREEQAAG